MLGIKTAITMMKEYGDGHKIIDACLQDPKFTVPDNYKADFDRAVLTFKHQRVYDPIRKDLVCLEPTNSDDPCIGPLIDKETLSLIVTGKISPFHDKIIDPDEEPKEEKIEMGGQIPPDNYNHIAPKEAKKENVEMRRQNLLDNYNHEAAKRTEQVQTPTFVSKRFFD